MMLSAYLLALTFIWTGGTKRSSRYQLLTFANGKPPKSVEFTMQWICDNNKGMSAKFVVPCDPHMFDSGVDDCLSDFNKSMETSGYQHSCPWPTVKRNYYELQQCVNKSALVSRCKGRGFLEDTVFLKVHKLYFRQCGQVQDPPPIALIMLIAPVIIVTLFLPILCTNLATWSMDTVKSLGL